MIIRPIEKSEKNTILAALRYYHNAGMGDPANRPVAIHDIATDDGAVISLDNDGIERLYREIREEDLLAGAATLLEECVEAVEYYHDREGCPNLLREVQEFLDLPVTVDDDDDDDDEDEDED